VSTETPPTGGTSPINGPGKPAFGSKAWHANLVWVAAIVLVIGTVAGFGGFKQRAGETIAVDPGTTVSLALADVQVLSATAKPTRDDNGNILPDGPWVVTVQAEVRATSRPISSSSFNNAIVIGYVNGQGTTTIQPAPDLFFMRADDPTLISARMVIPPSDQFTPVEFQAYIDDGLTAGQGLRVGLFPVVYGTSSNAVDGDTYLAWLPDNSAGHFWMYRLPIQITDQ